jgi:hypothetical protein
VPSIVAFREGSAGGLSIGDSGTCPPRQWSAGVRHFVLFWEIYPGLPVHFDRILTESVNKLTDREKRVATGGVG